MHSEASSYASWRGRCSPHAAVSNVGVLLETLGGLDSMKIRTAVRAGCLDCEERQEPRQSSTDGLNPAIANSTDWIDDFADAVLK